MLGWRTRSAFAFLGVAALLPALKLLFDYYPGDFPLRDQTAAFSWLAIGAIVLLGALGLGADHLLGLPRPFEDVARDRRGLWIATVSGLAYGLGTVGNDLINHAAHPLASEAASWPHVALPWSIPFYLFGAVFLELMLRLGALCIPVWVIHVVLLRRRFRNTVFWSVACLVATYEILPYVLEHIAAERWSNVALAPLQPLYWTNVWEAWLLLRFGWIAPIIFRLAFYLVWHILWGGLAPALRS
jgi:hypothetical protein